MGFSRFVSLGNQADVNETDVLEFLGNDPHTTTIAAYVEGITDGPRFMSVARQVTARKPVIALKVGTTGDGSRAVSSHTGALAGSEEAYDAAFRQTGILRAETIEDLLDWAHGLSTQPAPAGDGMAVLTNAGGPGVLAVDALQRAGLHLASLSQQTVGALRERFPPEATLTNPVDLLAAADAQGYADALALLLRDENVAGAVVLHVPHVLVRAPEVLDAIGRTAQGLGKPVVVSLFGDYAGTPELAALRGRGLPHFPSPERASRTMGAMRRYRRWQDRPASRPEELADVDRGAAAAVLRGVRREARVGLGDVETRRLLQAYGISVPPSALATDPASAVHAADEIGYPVAVKIASPDILHKTDAGGVALDLQNADAVSRAYQTVTERCLAHSPRATIWGVQVQKMMPRGREVIVGVNRDRQFGPLLMFGLGGVYVEALRDVSFRVIPITRRDAEDMIAETRAYRVLQGLRGEAPADLEAIVVCLLRVSRLLEDFPQIAELDINPLVAYEQGRGVVALDARAVMEPNEDHGLEPGDDREGQQGCDNRRYGDGADNSVGPGPARGSARALLPTA